MQSDNSNANNRQQRRNNRNNRGGAQLSNRSQRNPNIPRDPFATTNPFTSNDPFAVRDPFSENDQVMQQSQRGAPRANRRQSNQGPKNYSNASRAGFNNLKGNSKSAKGFGLDGTTSDPFTQAASKQFANNSFQFNPQPTPFTSQWNNQPSNTNTQNDTFASSSRRLTRSSSGRGGRGRGGTHGFRKNRMDIEREQDFADGNTWSTDVQRDPFNNTNEIGDMPVANASFDFNHNQFQAQDWNESGNQQRPTTERPNNRTNQLFLKNIPVALFSNQTVKQHFSSINGVTVKSVSLRGSRHPNSRRTAVISFGNPHEATLGLSKGRMYNGERLQLSVFRPTGNVQVDLASLKAQESHELVFTNVPEDLFSETAITNLFNSISGDSVIMVSTKERPHNGGFKRTAIIAFDSVSSAASALDNLPLYHGQKMQVSFRQKNAIMKNANQDQKNIGGDQQMEMDENDGYAPSFSRTANFQSNDTVSNEQFTMDMDTNKLMDEYYDLEQEQQLATDEQNQPAEDEKRKAELKDIEALREAIKRKEKERDALVARRKKASNGKGQSSSMRTRGRQNEMNDISATQGQNAVWRKVGEKVDINEAVEMVGTCQQMCPESEIDERIIQRDISMFETKDCLGVEVDRERAVKKYRRSAAISEAPRPEDVRPPPVLLRTMEHLKTMCDTEGVEFVDVHNFVRDRTRSLRQDLTLQGVKTSVSIQIHEESVRFHIMSEHRLYGFDQSRFSSKQNLEQLDKCLISLRELYDYRREENLPTSPNEAEMQAYYVLTQMNDPKTCVQLCTGFAKDVRQTLPVQFALQVVKTVAEPFINATAYFSLVRAAPYLMACLMHSQFTNIRARAFSSMNSVHGIATAKDIIPVTVLTKRLGFEDDKETREFCSFLGFDLAKSSTKNRFENQVVFPSTKVDMEKVKKWKARRADSLIESKSSTLTLSEIIKGVPKGDFDKSKLPYCSSSFLRKPLKSPGISTKVKKNTKSASDVNSELQVSLRKSSHNTNQDVIKPHVKESTFFANTFQEPSPRRDSQQPIVFAPNEGFSSQPKPSLSLSPAEPFKASMVPQAKPAIKIPTFRPEGFFTSIAPQTVHQKRPRSISPSETQPRKISNEETIFRLIDEEEVQEKRPEVKKKRISFATPDSAAPTVTPKSPLKSVPAPAPKPTEKPASEENHPQVPHIVTEWKTRVQTFVWECEACFNKVQKFVSEARKRSEFSDILSKIDEMKNTLIMQAEAMTKCAKETYIFFEMEEVGHLRTDMQEGFEDVSKKMYEVGNQIWQDLEKLDYEHSRKPVGDENVSDRVNEKSMEDSLSVHQRQKSTAVTVKGDVSKAELEKIRTDMYQQGIGRMQIAVCNVSTSTDREVGWTYEWVKNRLRGTQFHSTSILHVEDCPGEKREWFSVSDFKSSERLPTTAGMIVCALNERSQVHDIQEELSKFVSKLKADQPRRRERNLPPPAVIVVTIPNSEKGGNTQVSGHKRIAATFKSAFDEGVICDVQLVIVKYDKIRRNLTSNEFVKALGNGIKGYAHSAEKAGMKLRLSRLGSRMVQIANDAWMSLLDSTDERSTDCTLAIKAINDAWAKALFSIGVEAENWSSEMPQGKKQLKDIQAYVQKKLRLPLPNEINAADTSKYCEWIGTVSKVAYPDVTGPPNSALKNFCRGLGQLMVPYISYCLEDHYFTEILMPKGAKFCPRGRKRSTMTQRLRHHDIAKVIPPPVIERTVDGTVIDSNDSKKRELERLDQLIARAEVSNSVQNENRRLSGTSALGSPSTLVQEHQDEELMRMNRRASLTVVDKNSSEKFFDQLYPHVLSFGEELDDLNDELLEEQRRSSQDVATAL